MRPDGSPRRERCKKSAERQVPVPRRTPFEDRIVSVLLVTQVPRGVRELRSDDVIRECRELLGHFTGRTTKGVSP